MLCAGCFLEILFGIWQGSDGVDWSINFIDSLLMVLLWLIVVVLWSEVSSPFQRNCSNILNLE